MKKIAYVAMVVLLAAVLAAPAGASENAPPSQIPFDVPVYTSGTSVTVPSYGANGGFIGACDVQLQCYGVSVAASEAGGGASVGQAVLHLSGVICIHSSYAPCGATGDPGTGVVITQRDVVGPSASVTPPKVDFSLCTWRGDPRFSPRCVTDDHLIGTTQPIVVDNPELTAFTAAIPDSVLIRTGK